MITLLFLLSILFLLELMIAFLEGEWDLVYYVFITSFTDVCLSFINLSSACQVFQVLRCHLHRPEEVVPGALWSCSALPTLLAWLAALMSLAFSSQFSWVFVSPLTSVGSSYFCLFKKIFICFLALLGLRCPLGFSWGAGGCPPVVAASLTAEHRLQCGLFFFFPVRTLPVGVQGLSIHGSHSLELRLKNCAYRLSCSVACGIFPDQGLNLCLCLLHW